jgi:hypothetical protein
MNRGARLGLFIGLAGLLLAQGAPAEEETNLTVWCVPEPPHLFGQDGLESFRGRLAIIRSGPDAAMNHAGAREIRSLIGKGINLVWIRPTTKRALASSPGLHTFRHGTGTMVLVHPDWMTDLTIRPDPN